MSAEMFEHLLTSVGPLIERRGCRSRAPISAAERLVITLRYLAIFEWGDQQFAR